MWGFPNSSKCIAESEDTSSSRLSSTSLSIYPFFDCLVEILDAGVLADCSVK